MSDLHPRDFWSGQFGDEYIDRNVSDQLFASNLHFFSNILKSCANITSVIELGANVGMNIKALKLLSPGSNLHAVEINESAYNELSKLECTAHNRAVAAPKECPVKTTSLISHSKG